MNWYKGNIAEAVALSKSNNAIFVVYVAGKDEVTQKLTNFINEENNKRKLESEDFVAIKIDSDTQAYMQFAKIYQVVPVPSIFFIGSTGAPLEVGTGVINSADELEQKINKVLMTAGKSLSSAASASECLIAAELTLSQDAQPSTSNATVVETKSKDEIVCDGDVCFKPPKEQGTVDVPFAGKSTDESNLEETRILLEKKRRERIELEKSQEKERELRRRREGKEMQNLQSWQKEQELKELKENIRRERQQEQAARERIRAQIAGDRAERAQKFSAKSESVTVTSTVNSSQSTTSSSDQTRLQFRVSTGDTKSHTFNCHDQLGVVRQFVKSEILAGSGIHDFILATTYPKREFSLEDDMQSLIELGLHPSAVILVISKENSSNPATIIARSGGLLNIFSSFLWTILTPVFTLFGYIKAFGRGIKRSATDVGGENTGTQKRANEEQNVQHDAAKRRNLDRFLNNSSTSINADSAQNEASSPDHETNPSKAFRRYVGGSNIHRLNDKRKDSDDENATWNGNSTQQQ